MHRPQWGGMGRSRRALGRRGVVDTPPGLGAGDFRRRHAPAASGGRVLPVRSDHAPRARFHLPRVGDPGGVQNLGGGSVVAGVLLRGRTQRSSLRPRPSRYRERLRVRSRRVGGVIAEVHHRRPLSKHGKDKPDSALDLCPNCCHRELRSSSVKTSTSILNRDITTASSGSS